MPTDLFSVVGQSGSEKGTTLDNFNSLQGDGPDAWDDTVLNRLDNFMVHAHDYGIKLLVSIHSYNALEANSDFYGKWYGTGDFYTNNEAIGHFKTRIAHVLGHVNPRNGKTWAQSPEYIFAFEAQNEAMHPQVRHNPSNTGDVIKLTTHPGEPVRPSVMAVHDGTGN